MANTILLDWRQSLADLGPIFSQRAADYDRSDRFVSENYADMREAKLFSALVPAEFGGGGISYVEACSVIRELGRNCASTALAFSMHQHLVAATLWNHRHGKPGEKLLRAVAAGEKVLVSTGATDWLASNGVFAPCEGGFRFAARKAFASGCVAGDLLITSGQYDDPVAGLQVLHCAIPMSAEGIRIEPDWDTMGMHGTGSHTVVLENVFVPEQAIALRRPCGQYHPVWNIVLTVALPLICAAYVGAAESAARIAQSAATRKRDGVIGAVLVGEMENELTTAQIALESMIANVKELDFEPTIEYANRSLIRKTITVEAVKRTVEKALEVTGGGSYFRSLGLERILRDIEAAQFHPLPAKKQQQFTGRIAMGLDPVVA